MIRSSDHHGHDPAEGGNNERLGPVSDVVSACVKEEVSETVNGVVSPCVKEEASDYIG